MLINNDELLGMKNSSQGPGIEQDNKKISTR
jgi:hypothetical protein